MQRILPVSTSQLRLLWDWLIKAPAASTLASRLHAQTILQTLAKAPAQLQSNIGSQYDLVLASFPEFQPANPLEVHDDRAVDTGELFLAQVFLQFRQRATHDVRIRTDMQAGVIARSLDPVDVRRIQEQHLTPTFDHQSFCGCRVRGRVVGEFVLGATQRATEARII